MKQKSNVQKLKNLRRKNPEKITCFKASENLEFFLNVLV